MYRKTILDCNDYNAIFFITFVSRKANSVEAIPKRQHCIYLPCKNNNLFFYNSKKT